MRIGPVGMASALAIACPVAAQTASPPPAAPSAPAPAIFTVAPIPPTDPVRLAAARPVIDKLWPVGSYARLIHTIMGPVMQDSMARSFNMKLEDLLPGMADKPKKAGGKPAESPTLGQMAAKDDPYFQQRVTLTMNAVGDQMAKLMTGLEPGIRDALAHAYARRFTVVQLGDLDRFFATPTGRAYAEDAMTLMMSPDMTQAMQNFVPDMVKAAPEFIAAVTAATKDLPPAGKKKAASTATKDAPAPDAPAPPAKKTP